MFCIVQGSAFYGVLLHFAGFLQLGKVKKHCFHFPGKISPGFKKKMPKIRRHGNVTEVLRDYLKCIYIEYLQARYLYPRESIYPSTFHKLVIKISWDFIIM